MIDLTPWLKDIERRINPEEETAIYEAWKRFALGEMPEGEAFVPPFRTPVEAGIEWKHVNINDAVADEDLMILSQLERCHTALRSGGNTMMTMRPNYGVGIISSMFGAKPFIMPYDWIRFPTCIRWKTERRQFTACWMLHRLRWWKDMVQMCFPLEKDLLKFAESIPKSAAMCVLIIQMRKGPSITVNCSGAVICSMFFTMIQSYCMPC